MGNVKQAVEHENWSSVEQFEIVVTKIFKSTGDDEFVCGKYMHREENQNQAL